MIRTVLFLFGFLLLSLNLNAQDSLKFNEIYRKTYTETSQHDFKKAVEVADSLFRVSKTPLYQTRSLMLSASLYEKSGDLKKSIEYAKKAFEIVKPTDNYVWQTRILGFLASQHRMLSLHQESKNYVEQAILTVHKIQPPEQALTTLGFLSQEKAFGAEGRKEYRDAIASFNQAGEYFKKGGEDPFLMAQNSQFIGHCYLNLKEPEQAKPYFESALQYWGDMPDNYVNGLIYVGLADVYLSEKNYPLSKANLDKAEEIAKDSDYLVFLERFYQSKIDYYSAVADAEQLKLAYSKRDSVQALISDEKDQFMDKSFSQFKNETESKHNKLIIRNYIIGFGVILILSLILFLVWFRSKKKSQISKMKNYIEKLQNTAQPEKQENTEEINVQKPKTEESPMSAEAEEKILAYLKKFEENHLYTKNELSLSWLATYCKTNNKYLTYCINQHKQKDFNNYINELKVGYIIQKLLNEPIYRKYKLSTLSEEVGFSSPSKFSTVFKKETGVSPSVFIAEIDKKKTEKGEKTE